jgi:hypothetical protein
MMKKTCVISFTMLLMAGGRPALAVRNGLDAGEDFPKSIFHTLLMDGQKERPESCTAWAYKYKRCLVTAAHCVKNGGLMIIMNGPNPKNDPANSKKSTGKFKSKPSSEMMWTDIAVVFADLVKGQTPEMDSGFLKDADYSPLEVGDDMGLASVAYDGTFPGKRSVGAPKQMLAIGYGMNQTDTNVTPPLDKGVGKKRKGNPLVYNYAKGSAQQTPRTGSLYQWRPRLATAIPPESDVLAIAVSLYW